MGRILGGRVWGMGYGVWGIEAVAEPLWAKRRMIDGPVSGLTLDLQFADSDHPAEMGGIC